MPPALFLTALAAMLVALARPAAVVTLATQHETVILAVDVSGSMKADDVKPTRLAAAQAARSLRQGHAALDAHRPGRLRRQRGDRAAADAEARGALHRDRQAAARYSTAVGSGILARSRRSSRTGIRAVDGEAMALARRSKSRPRRCRRLVQGSAIILLTDGQTTSGPDPVDAARLAAARGVRVFTVASARPAARTLNGEGWSVHVRLDEDALKVIADLTRAEYFFAGNAPDLKKIYQGLNSRLVMEKKETEIGALFVGLAAALSLLAAALSLLWFNRLL